MWFLRTVIIFLAVRATEGATRPNIVVFMPDDMGFIFPEAPRSNVEESFMPSPSLIPHMYRVRKEGAVFQSAYVSGPKCAPSRFSVLTGRYCSRGIYARSTATVETDGQERFRINVPQCKLAGLDEFNNLQSVLSTNGYATIHSGKWHLAPSSVATYETDYAEAVAAVNNTGFSDVAAVYIENVGNSLNFSHNLEWMTSTALDKVEAAVDKNQPFFLYFAPTTPHAPSSTVAIKKPLRLTPAGWLDSDPDSGMPDRSTVLDRRVIGPFRDESVGTIWTDDALGAIIAKLEALDIWDNTILVVTMDHGVIAKDTLYEEGVRVALFVKGPNVIAGINVSHAVTNLDLLPTLLEAAGLGISCRIGLLCNYYC